MRFVDLTGKRFGHLTVLRRDGTYISPKGSTTPTWLCRCDCGNLCTVLRTSLKSGGTVSCGCERAKTHFNDYYIENGVAHIACNNGEFLIDEEYIALVQKDRWHINKNGYVARNRDKKTLHRIILGAKAGDVVDHINQNKTDNRKENLRIANPSINGYNKNYPIGESGERYISYNKGNGYYIVYIDGVYKGCSKDLQEAIRIRNEALVGSNAMKYNYQNNFFNQTVQSAERRKRSGLNGIIRRQR